MRVNFSCVMPTAGTTSLVEVPVEEYGQVAFKPDWLRIRHLVNPVLIEGMTRWMRPPPSRPAGMKSAKGSNEPAFSGRVSGRSRW